MKYLMPLVLLPTLAFAAPQEEMKGPSFEQFKQTMQPAIEQSLPDMKKGRACISKAESKEDVEACMKAMAEMARKAKKKLGMPEDMPKGGPSEEEISKAKKDFEWNEETKSQMLMHMDRSIQQNGAMLECLGKSKTGEEMTSCMQKIKPAK